MKDTDISTLQLQCPSAEPDMTASIAFGVVSGTVEEPQVAYLTEPQPVTDEMLALTKPVNPTEVIRFAAPCAKGGCKHFDGQNCRLVKRAIQLLPEVVDVLPPCKIRRVCMWWHQEGKAACLRCPQIVTEVYAPTEIQNQVADFTQ